MLQIVQHYWPRLCRQVLSFLVMKSINAFIVVVMELYFNFVDK